MPHKGGFEEQARADVTATADKCCPSPDPSPPRAHLLLQLGEDELLQNVIQHPHGDEGCPAVQEVHHRVAVPRLPLCDNAPDKRHPDLPDQPASRRGKHWLYACLVPLPRVPPPPPLGQDWGHAAAGPSIRKRSVSPQLSWLPLGLPGGVAGGSQAPQGSCASPPGALLQSRPPHLGHGFSSTPQDLYLHLHPHVSTQVAPFVIHSQPGCIYPLGYHPHCPFLETSPASLPGEPGEQDKQILSAHGEGRVSESKFPEWRPQVPWGPHRLNPAVGPDHSFRAPREHLWKASAERSCPPCDRSWSFSRRPFHLEMVSVP